MPGVYDTGDGRWGIRCSTRSGNRGAASGRGGGMTGAKYLASQIDAVSTAMPYRVVGEVVGISGLTIEATELALPVGSLCRITSFGGKTCVAEVIGFQQERTLLMALGAVGGVARGDKIANISAAPSVGCSEELLGRVLD